MIGVVAFSFAKRDEDQEPNPSNIQLAKAVERIIDDLDNPVVIVQWEIARQLDQDGYYYNICVTQQDASQKSGRPYLDSADVWRVAKAELERYHITSVVIVAQPFLHLGGVQRMAQHDGYTVLPAPIGRIPFDPTPLNRQWWCKGPLRLLAYAVIVALTRRHGIGERAYKASFTE